MTGKNDWQLQVETAQLKQETAQLKQETAQLEQETAQLPQVACGWVESMKRRYTVMVRFV